MSMNVNPGGGPRAVDALRALLAPVPNATLNITGHSLGSALATLLALDVVENSAFAKPSVTTLASPMVGDTQFARTYNTEVPDTWRIANWMDLVPKLPPSNWGYDHVGPDVSGELARQSQSQSVLRAHPIDISLS